MGPDVENIPLRGRSSSIFQVDDSPYYISKDHINEDAKITTIMNNNMVRQTGRTTRMMAAAIKIASEGKPVRIIAATQQDVEIIKREWVGDYPNLELITVGKLVNFDWVTMSDMTVHESTRVFIDHAVIERVFGRMLYKLHEYDLKIK